MDPSKEVPSGKNFYVVLDNPDSVFKSRDIVSGKCCLLSHIDEDVGSVTISFHGVVKLRFFDTDPHRVYGVHTLNHYEGNNHDSEEVLFADTKLLYQGPYTLRKEVLYEWPFHFQFPLEPLPPSGRFGKDHFHSANISYELEACRGRTSEDIALLQKRITPLNHYRNANMHRTLLERFGEFKGMVTTLPLKVLTTKQWLIEPTIVTCVSNRSFPPHHGLFHAQKKDVSCQIRVNLPKNLAHDEVIHVSILIESGSSQPPILQAAGLYLKSTTTLISSLGQHRHTEISEIQLFSESKFDRQVEPNCTLDIGEAFKIRLDPSVIPNFTHPQVELSYSLRMHLVLQVEGRSLEEDFVIEEVQVNSNIQPNSPLELDHTCVFQLDDRRADAGLPQYPGLEKGDMKDISEAYSRVSQLLTQNSIPHDPISKRPNENTLTLHGHPRLSAVPLSQLPSASPFSQSRREDALSHDMRLLDAILTPELGFKASTMRSGRAAIERFGYAWISPSAPPLSLKARVRETRDPSVHFEIWAVGVEGKEMPPPGYSVNEKPEKASS